MPYSVLIHLLAFFKLINGQQNIRSKVDLTLLGDSRGHHRRTQARVSWTIQVHLQWEENRSLFVNDTTDCLLIWEDRETERGGGIFDIQWCNIINWDCMQLHAIMINTITSQNNTTFFLSQFPIDFIYTTTKFQNIKKTFINLVRLGEGYRPVGEWAGDLNHVKLCQSNRYFHPNVNNLWGGLPVVDQQTASTFVKYQPNPRLFFWYYGILRILRKLL